MSSKFNLVSLIVVVGTVLTACSGPSSDAALRLQVAADGVEVAAYESLVSAFEAANPEIVIELVPVSSHGDHMAKLAADFAAGDPADLFIVNYRRFGQLARSGAIIPAADYIDQIDLELADLFPEPVEAFKVDGKLMCLPQNASSVAVYYNRALFEQAEVPEPPAAWTWEDFVETSRALTQDTDGDGATDIYGLATEASLIRMAPFVWQAGGDIVDDAKEPTKMTLFGDEAIKAMSYFIDLRREHKIAPSLEEAEAEDPEARFARGGAAMMLDSRRATANLRQVEGLDFDVAPLPHDVNKATALHADGYCISSRSKRAAEAQKLIEFAMSEEGQSLLSKTGRLVPARISVALGDSFLDPTQMPSRAKVWLDQLKYIRLMPNIAAWNEIETLSEPIIEEWFYGTEPPENLGIEIDLATRALFVDPGSREGNS